MGKGSSRALVPDFVIHIFSYSCSKDPEPFMIGEITPSSSELLPMYVNVYVK